MNRRPREVLDEPLRTVEVAVEDDDAEEAGRDERLDDGPGTTAGPEDDRSLGHLLVPDERLERRAETEHLGVVPHEVCPVLGDRVDRARPLGLLGQAVEHGDDAFLVRHPDARAQVVAAAQGLHRVRQGHGGSVDRLVHRVDAGSGECGALERLRQRMRYRMAE